MLLRFIYLSGFIHLEDSGQQLLVTDQIRCVRRVTNMATPAALLRELNLDSHSSGSPQNAQIPSICKSKPAEIRAPRRFKTSL